MNSFSFSDLDPKLSRAISGLGFERPTPIQQSAIPPGLAGRDVLACAMTGSGKTAAFLLPILERLLARPPGATRALVVSPTRELASQTVDHFRDLARHTKLRAAAVYGGVGMGPQIQAFRRGADLLVACPGRLLDHFQYPYAKLAKLEVLVLDEADRMLDMGFLPDIRRIIKHLPPIDQRLLFSATMPPAIAELSRGLLESPVRIDVERPSAPAKKVTQAVFAVPQAKKPALLLELLRRGEIHNALVFTRTKHRADRLANALDKLGVASDRIHGNRSQAQRTRALDGFKRGRTRVLVATDIAARGIDVEALSHVVNFDVPHMAEDYIHRVGRTARAEKSGEALTFVAPQEHADLRTIERAVGRLPRRQLEGFDINGGPVAGLWTPQGGGTDQAPARPERSVRRRSPAEQGGQRPAGQDGRRPAEQNGKRPAARDGQRPAARDGQRPAARDGRRSAEQGGQRPARRQRPAARAAARPDTAGRHQARPSSDDSPRDHQRRQGGQPEPSRRGRRPADRSQRPSTSPQAEHRSDRNKRPTSARPTQDVAAKAQPPKKRRRRTTKPKTTAFATFERDNDLSRPRRRRASRVAYP